VLAPNPRGRMILAPAPQPLPTGDTFACIRVAEHHAMAALIGLMRVPRAVGPVFAHGSQVYFIVRPNTGHEPWPRWATYCGRGTVVTLPPPHCPDSDPARPRWLIHRRDTGRRFTNTRVLREALEDLDQQPTTASPVPDVALRLVPPR